MHGVDSAVSVMVTLQGFGSRQLDFLFLEGIKSSFQKSLIQLTVDEFRV